MLKALGKPLPDCTKCDKPLLLEQNLLAYDICQQFGPIIFDGEHVSPEGINHAMVWYNVPIQERCITARKIMLFFVEARKCYTEKEELKEKNTVKGKKYG